MSVTIRGRANFGTTDVVFYDTLARAPEAQTAPSQNENQRRDKLIIRIAFSYGRKNCEHN